jgi:predicted alpha/beta-hydrolase family hydrolase
MLHGGTQQSTALVDGRSASWRRSAVMQRALARPAHDAGASVWLLRYRRRGWNGGMPVADARWALGRIREELGEVPVVLLGHSMGARTAVHVADDPLVQGVVALAPWFPPGEPVAALSGRRLVAAHGRRDRITSYDATAAYVDRAGRVATSAELRDMGALGHYLVKGARTWNRVAREESLAMLAGSTGARQS